MRSNYQPGASKSEPDAMAVQEQSLKAATQGSLDLIEQAVARIKRGEGAQAALREICASLLEIKAIVRRDPGIRQAADDLYGAAAVLVAGKSDRPAVVDFRRWRLLKEAHLRLRARLASA